MSVNEASFPNNREITPPATAAAKPLVNSKASEIFPSTANEGSASFSYSAAPLSSPHDLKEIVQQQEKLKEQINAAETGILILSAQDTSQATSLVSLIQKKGEKIVDRLIVRLNEPVSKEKLAETAAKAFMLTDPFAMPFLETLEILASEASASVPINDVLRVSEAENIGLLDRCLENTTAGVEIGMIFINTLGKAAVMIAMTTLINKTKEVLEAKKQTIITANAELKTVLEREVLLLESWIAHQKLLIKQQLVRGSLLAGLALPKLGSSIAHVLGKGSTTTGAVFGWMIMGVSLVASALEWRKAHREIIAHQLWCQEIISNQTVEQMLNKHYQVDLARLNHLLKPYIHELTIAASQSPHLQQEKLKEILEQLRNKKLFIEHLAIAQSPNELLDMLNASYIQKQLLSSPALLHSSAVATSLRQGLKTFIAKKAQIDRGFLKLKLHKIKGMFTLTVLVTALTIILKVLILVGVASVAGALVATGYGMLALAAFFSLLGLAYLYYKKPNLFKTYLQALQIRVGFKGLQLAIAKFRRQNAVLETSRISEAAHVLASRLLHVETLLKQSPDDLKVSMLPQELIEQLNAEEKKQLTLNKERSQELLEIYHRKLAAQIDKNEQQARSISQKATVLHHSIEKLEKAKKVLQKRIQIAGWKDYQKLLHGYAKKDTSKAKQEDAAMLLARSLLGDQALIRETETLALLTHMRIDLTPFKLSEDPEELVEALAENFRTFFAMDDEHIIKMISNKSNIRPI